MADFDFVFLMEVSEGWRKSLSEIRTAEDASRGFGIAPTLMPLPTWFGGVKVDHILINRGLSVSDYQLGETRFSDHRPVSVDFQIRGFR